MSNVEFFEAEILRCPHCESEWPDYAGDYDPDSEFADSCCHLDPYIKTGEHGVWYWYCQPGCLPDSDPFGPFDSMTDAENDEAGSWED